MRAYLTCLTVLLASGCISIVPPITDPAPLTAPVSESAYAMSVSGVSEIEGGLTRTNEVGRSQSRTAISVRGEGVLYRSVEDVTADPETGLLASFRYVKDGPQDDMDLRGEVEGDTLTIHDADGDLVVSFPWSSEHRFSGASSDDLLRAGLREGMQLTVMSYEPWHDERGVHLKSYTVLENVPFQRYDGEEVPAWRLRVESPHLENGITILVDADGRLLEAVYIVPGGSFAHRMTVTLTSYVER